MRLVQVLTDLVLRCTLLRDSGVTTGSRIVPRRRFRFARNRVLVAPGSGVLLGRDVLGSILRGPAFVALGVLGRVANGSVVLHLGLDGSGPVRSITAVLDRRGPRGLDARQMIREGSPVGSGRGGRANRGRERSSVRAVHAKVVIEGLHVGAPGSKGSAKRP